MTVPLLLISLFTTHFHEVVIKNWRLFIRIGYFLLAIFVDYLSTNNKIKLNTIQSLSWILSIISILPIPYFKTSNQNNILLKFFLSILPFYILLTVSHEGLFLIIFYDYLQLWIKMKWREIPEEIEEKDEVKVNKKTFNLIDIFSYMSLTYASAFSTGNVASISGFTLSSVFRFISKYWPILITTLIMIKILIPSIFVTLAHFEICKQYKYSSSDSLFMIIAMCEVMNIKFFLDIRDFGSWLQIGMSIAFFVISNVIAFMQFLSFLFVNVIILIDNKVNDYEELTYEEIIPKKQDMELELGLKNENNNE